jgi:hypothetical protein
MVFDNNFINQNNLYLQQKIKNQEIVKEQFYPRFVQWYNTNVPFTEGTMNESIVEHPQSNTLIKPYLKPESLSQVKENLNLKLTHITGDKSMSDFIINHLSIEELYYYNEHFSEVQTHLLKLIHLPTSKEQFIVALKGLLANDPHRNNINAISNMIKPPSSPSITAPPQISAPSTKLKIPLKSRVNTKHLKTPIETFEDEEYPKEDLEYRYHHLESLGSASNSEHNEYMKLYKKIRNTKKTNKNGLYKNEKRIIKLKLQNAKIQLKRF